MNDNDAVEQFWEQHYGRREQIWSGRPNAVLVKFAEGLSPGTALDLGCGEGGDAIWLAQRGWRVTGVDVSPTALERTTRAAAAAGVADRIECQRHDLARTFPAGAFDLVSAQYLQSPLELPRGEILRRAAAVVGTGGLLLVVEHGSVPPWAPPRHAHAGPHKRFSSPEELRADLDLDPGQWRLEFIGAPERFATGPEGKSGMLTDVVVAARRVGH